MILVDAAINALREATADDSIDLKGFSHELPVIVKSAKAAAAKVDREEFDSGDNYGFSGAADTWRYIYRYIERYIETVNAGLALDSESCVNAFSGALKVYAISSCDGDPKGAVNIAIEAAEKDIASAIGESYANIDDSLKHWVDPVASVKGPPVGKRTDANPTQSQAPHPNVDWGMVFISCSSKDYQHAQKLFEFLEQNDVPVFFSEQSLPKLGSSDYRRAIDTALDQAHHMVVVTSARENVDSPWVEAEWGAFINEKRSGRKSGNLLTITAGEISPNDLPMSLRQYEVIPLETEGLSKLLEYLRSTP